MPTKPKKLSVAILFDDTLDSTDGVAQAVKTLGAWLSSQGHQVSYLVGETKLKEWSGGKVYSLSKNQIVNFNGNKLSIPLPGNGRKIKQFMKEHQFDVINVTVPYSPFMAAKVIKAASPQTAIVGTFHIFPAGKLSRIGSRFLKLMLAGTLRRFSEVAAVSRSSADFAKSHYGLDAQVIPNPVKTAGFKTQNVKKDDNLIVFLGRLVKRKGALQLIEAFAVLEKVNSKARLIIAGDGPQRKMLESKAAELNLESKVNFLGYIDEADKPELLARAAVACFPSLYGEAFGIVLIEAMAAGSWTILGGDNPGYASVLGDRPELLINPKDSQLFAKRFNELLTNPQKSEVIHAWQQQQVKKYDIAVVGNQTLAMYDRAIARLAKNSHNSAHE